MKTLVGIFVLMAGGTMTMAQGALVASIPTPVMQSFTAMYPNVKDVAWDYNEPNYEARFKVRNKGMMLMFDETGSVHEVKNEVPAVELPGTVREYLRDKYGDWHLAKAMHVVVNEEPYHEAYLQKGKEEVILVFDRNAQLFVTVLP